jgi:hypothetical protein
MKDACLWKHIENWDTTDLSEEERERVGKEAREIARFVDITIQEGNHLDYVRRVLGEDDLENKLIVLLGPMGLTRYQQAVRDKEKQKHAEAAAKAARIRWIRYQSLVDRVRKKYQEMESQKHPCLGLYHLGKQPSQHHLSLWNYWQGCNFDDVKLMLLKLDWGSVNDPGTKMKECLKKIRAINRKDYHAKYYICKYQRVDIRLKELFDKCFERRLQDEHYSDLFFSTLCLGYRKNRATELPDALVEADIDEFLLEELSIIAPKVVCCLGAKVYGMFIEGLARQGIEAELQNVHEEFAASLVYVDGHPIRVYMLPYCGGKLTDEDMDRQSKVWSLIRQDMQAHGIIL